MIFSRFGISPCLLLLAGIFTSGCGQESERLLEQAVEQTFPMDSNARVTIRNVDGAIRVYGSKGSEAKMQAIKKAYGQARLDKIVVNASAQANSLTIDTVFPPRPKLGWSDRSGVVDYTITLPAGCTISRLELANGEVLIDGMRGGQVTARLVNGRLFDHNGFGKHDLFVANGGLDVIFEWWEPGRFSTTAKIVNGNAHAFIPSEASFHLLATATSGKIANDFGDKAERAAGGTHKVEMSVGQSPQAAIELHATEGNVAVTEANP